MIFNSSIAEGVFPEAWKIAAVTPIHKAGNKQSVENYRGISILCTLSKVLESLIHEKLYAAVRPMLSDYQHGFVKQRSTVTNLMSYVSSLNACLEKRQQVDAIYIDFSKAFDKVPHETALKKLDRLGLPTWIVNWLRSYLSNRTAYVKIGTHKSRPFAATSGVPQGSHLGPLIFILFVNDLCSLLHCDKLMYADDLKLFRIISSALDCAALQEDLRRLEDWCQLNGMNANAGKCKVISFSRSYTQLSYDYQLDSNVLERVTSIKDLGVIVDSKLGFAEHISATTAKSFAVLGFIQRTAADFDDIYTLKVLFFALVRSTLEYAVQVWAPHHASQSVRIERVQKKFVRFALRRLPWNDPQQLPPYEDRCQLIELNTLSWRRTLLDRLFVFDILAGNIDCPDLLSRIHFNVPARSLRHQPSLWVPRHRTNYGQNNPLDRCCKNFNDVFSLYDPGISKRVFKLRIFSV